MSLPSLPTRYATLFNAFKELYLKATVQTPDDLAKAEARLACFLTQALDQFKNPHAFALLHRAIRAPFDYYTFGLDFMRPLIDLSRSCLLGVEWLKKIEESRKTGGNIIFLSNHQIEADPQVLSILFEPHAPRLAEEIFFIAGARVTSDPFAIPFTLGRNILSVHSKNHMDQDPQKRAAEQTHNLRTLSALSQLLDQGGNAIYVAPSGGRDRPSADGTLLPEPFDPHSIRLFTLLAKKAHQPVHFYPMALSTHAILPPPSARQTELGEERIVAKSGVGIAIGAPLEFPSLTSVTPTPPLSTHKEDREASKQADTHAAWSAVLTLYETLQRHLKHLAKANL